MWITLTGNSGMDLQNQTIINLLGYEGLLTGFVVHYLVVTFNLDRISMRSIFTGIKLRIKQGIN